ncbi:MAG: methyltransferase [Myxococcaceae bacterium]|nr:methyltransferase [Myxococcaceae bacterium]
MSAGWSLSQQVLRLVRDYTTPAQRAALTRLQRRHRLQWPRTGSVDFGGLRRVTPVSRIFGLDRGLPIDRYYIEKFLALHAADVQGRALELGDSFYIDKYGQGRVTQIDVLHVKAGNPQATIVADLTDAPMIPSNTFDCIIFTQSLQMIYDLKAALRTLHRILRPGGVLLVTSAGIAKIGRRLERDGWGEYWHLTTQSMNMLLRETLPGATVTVGSYGNVLSTTAFLHGLATDELLPSELDFVDPDFELLVTAHVRKAAP